MTRRTRRILLIGVIALVGVIGPTTIVGQTPSADAAAPAPRQVSYENLGPADLEVVMAVDATPREIRKVRRFLSGASGRAEAFAHLDRQDAHDEFTRIYRLDPQLVSQVSARDLPVSFRVRVADPVPERATSLGERITGLPGVDDVAYALSTWSSELRRDLIDRQALSTECGSGPDRDLEAFLSVGADPVEIQQIEAAVASLSEVATTRFVSPDEALARFRCMFAGAPDLIETTEASELPASLEIVLEPGVDREDLARIVGAAPGVENVAVML